MVRSVLRQAAVLSALVMAVLGLCVKPAEATHFRYGHMYWERVPASDTATTATVRIVLETGWRRSFPWTPFFPVVGDVLSPQAGGIAVVGNGGYSTLIPATLTVTAIDAANDLMYTRTEATVAVPWSAFPLDVTWQSSSRLSTLLDGNNDGTFSLTTRIDVARSTRSPRSAALPMILLGVNQTNTIQIPSVAFDNRTNRFRYSSVTESSLVTATPSGMTLSPSGLVQFTPTRTGLYAVQFMIESVDANGVVASAAPLDILFNAMSLTGLPVPSLSTPQTTINTVVGQTSFVDITSTLTPAAAGYTGTIVNTPLGARTTVTPATTATGSAPFTYRLTHAPLAGDASSVVCFQSTYSATNGLVLTSQGQLCVTLNVVQYSAPTIACSVPQSLVASDASGANATVTASFTQSPSDPVNTPLSLAWTVDGTPLTPVSIAGTESSGSRSLTQLFAVGSHTVSAQVTDGTNTAFCSTTVDVNPATTSLTTPSGTNPVNVGQSNTLSSTLSLAATGAGVAGQTLTFAVTDPSGTTTSTDAVTDAAGQASVTATPTQRGNYSARASFPGSTTLGSALSSAFPFTVLQATSLSAVTGMGDTVNTAFAVTTRLTDLPSGTPVVGASVIFSITGASTQTKTALTNSNGTASVAFILSVKGAYNMTASYNGVDFRSSTSSPTATFNITKSPTTLAALSAPTTSMVGDGIVTTTTLTSQNTALPGQTVTFTLNRPTGGPLTLNGTTDAQGAATVSFQAAGISRGAHTLTANFAGDSNNGPATTAPLSINVYQKTALTMPAVQGSAGTPTTVSATLLTVPGGTPVPGQTVTFQWAGGPVQAVTDANGVATFNVTFPNPGTFPATASFSNVAGFFANVNGALAATTVNANIVVNTATALSLAPASGTAGAPVTLSATLTNAATNAPIAGQSVLFDFGGVAPAVTAVTDANGAASTSVTFALSGTYTVDASFSNLAAQFLPSTASQSVVVNAAATALNALSLPPIAFVGDQVTATTVLTRTSAPAGPLAGRTVTFTLTTPSAAQVQLSGQTDAVGHVSVSFPALVARGAYSLVASYAGDATYAPTSTGAAAFSLYQRVTLSLPTVQGVATTPTTFTATLTTVPGGSPVPGETVTFTWAGGPVQAVTNASGVATFTLTFPTAGTFPAAASFSNVAGFFANANGALAPTTASASIVMASPDTTPPVITPTITGVQNNGWYTSDVSITFSVTDAESTITSQTGCGPASVTADGAAFTFTCSADSSGGSATQIVTVKRDTTAPQLTVPPAQTAEATSPQGVVVAYPAATALDATSGVAGVACVPASGSTFAIGPTAVVCTVTDNAGNTASDSFTVTVRDTTAPSLTLPSNITVHAALPTGAVVTYSATALDIVDGARPVSCTPASGSVFPIASTTVTCSTADTRGNPASGNFLVTVTNSVPTSVGDTYSTDANKLLTVAAPGVLGNDDDADGDALTAQVATLPAHGTLTLNATGGFSYTPTPNYAGPDSFTYRATDGRQVGLPATVTLTVASPTSIFAEVRAILVGIDSDLGNDADKIIEKKFEKGCEEAQKLSRSIVRDSHYTAAQKAVMVAALARLTSALGCVAFYD